MCGLALRTAAPPPAPGALPATMPAACTGCLLHDAGIPAHCPRCGYELKSATGGAGWLGRMRCALRHWIRPAGAGLILLAVSISTGAFAASATETPVSRSRFLMGTLCEAAAYGEGAGPAIEAAFNEMARLEQILSDYRDDSELTGLNQRAGSGPVACSTDLFEFLSEAVRHSRDTGGAFDITVGPLMRVWDLRGRGRLPSTGEIASALRLTGWSRIELDAGSGMVSLPPGMSLDPGALGKGFALDAAARVLRERGIRSALLDFGGQVLALDPPPGATAWEVDVAHPLRRDMAAVTIHVRNVSVSTSGNSERGVHVIDPRTGQPVHGPRSATVISPNAAQADALSTALLVMGPNDGLAWAASREGIAALYLEPADNDTLLMQATDSFTGYNPSWIPRAGSHNHRRN